MSYFTSILTECNGIPTLTLKLWYIDVYFRLNVPFFLRSFFQRIVTLFYIFYSTFMCVWFISSSSSSIALRLVRTFSGFFSFMLETSSLTNSTSSTFNTPCRVAVHAAHEGHYERWDWGAGERRRYGCLPSYRFFPNTNTLLTSYPAY